MKRRGIEIGNRINEPKRFTKNKTIMDMVAEYVEETKKENTIIPPINQVRIWKKMRLPCELVGFDSSRKTKEAREETVESCVK